MRTKEELEEERRILEDHNKKQSGTTEQINTLLNGEDKNQEPQPIVDIADYFKRRGGGR